MTEFEKWLNKKIILLDNIGLDIDGYSLAELKAYQKVLAKYQELVDKETPKEARIGAVKDYEATLDKKNEGDDHDGKKKESY